MTNVEADTPDTPQSDEDSDNSPREEIRKVSKEKSWHYIEQRLNSTGSKLFDRTPCCCSCLFFILSRFQPPRDWEEERRSFERTVTFLRSVPLFKKYLPSSELPKVARDLERKLWRPGEKLVRQGEVGRTFFLIQNGEANVVVADDAGKEKVRATLYPGDYFGGHTLVTESINVGTVVAKNHLVTLSMSRRVFEESGLKAQLVFPKRPALYVDREADDSGSSPSARRKSSFAQLTQYSKPEPKSAEEEAFLLTSLRNNPNFRSLLNVSDASFKQVTAAAVRVEVPRDTVVARAGEMGQEFFVVKSGCFHARAEPEVEGQKSVETAVAKFAMSERLKRKQAFIKTLCKPPFCKRQTQSGLAPDFKGLEEESDDMNVKLTFRRGNSVRNDAERKETRVSSTLTHPRSRRTAKKPAAASEVVAELRAGDSFGELSLIYNTFREATFVAVEDSVVYVIGRRHFKDLFNRKGPRFKEYCDLLDEVPALSGLLQAERWELACNAVGLFNFRPRQRMLTQDVKRKGALWYVIFSGSCVISREERSKDGKVQVRILGKLQRAGHFGERSLLLGGVDEATPEVNVDAGPAGMTCLAFEGQSIMALLEELFNVGAEDEILPNVSCDVGEYEHAKFAKNGNKKARFRAQASEVLLTNLRKVCFLGKGGFAEVFLVEEPSTKTRYALKRLSKGHIEKSSIVQQVCWERELLLMVDSPFIICLHRTYKDQQFIYLLMEAALGGSLYQAFVAHPEVFFEDRPRGSSAAFYVACIIAGIEHLHERRIVYRDLKPENVLLDERGYAKLCDMGFARFVLGKTNTLAGTPEYMAPEVIDFPHAHGLSADWWSLGVLTFELIAGQPPWEDEGISDTYGRLLAIRRSQERSEPRYPFSCPALTRDFISKLMKKIPGRLGEKGASDVRQHAWFKHLKFDFEALKQQTLTPPFSSQFQISDHMSRPDRERDIGLMEHESFRSASLYIPCCGSCKWDAEF